jgi:CubicO group peptidase (beta-lactamase class C family)
MLRRILDKTGYVLAVSLALTGLAPAQNSADRMDKVAQSHVDAQQFMGSVLVARGDTVLFSKAYGSANLEWNIPNATNTKFRLGSVTKQFTAAAVLLLEERGKLKVEDPVKLHYPDAPPAWDKITLHHLLTHTAGIPNFTGFPDHRSWTVQPATPDDIVKRFRDKPLEFVPGQEMRYSNSGYALLGAVIERASGSSYAKFVQDNLFTPAGMKDSGYDSSSAIIARRAAGYRPGPGGTLNAAYLDMTVPYAAGGLYSTTEDLLRWEQALFGGKILSAASLRKMTTPAKNDYAFGLSVDKNAGHKVIQHSGGIDGFNTKLAYYPDDKVTVVALSNLNGPGADSIVDKLGALAHGAAVQLISERKEITVPTDVLKKYVGTYAAAPEINMMITLDGEQLVSQVSGQGKVPLFAQSATSFFTKAVDAQLDFVKDASGAVTELVLHQGGRDTRAKRTSDTVAQRREIALPTATLQQFVGTYELRPGFDMVITLAANQLTLTPTGQDPDALFAESGNRFFSKRIDAQIEFVRDATGVVTHLMLHQGNFHGKAQKKAN